jgi:hypothetical protein
VPKDDRILSQSEIDSLLKKIMPKSVKPASSEQTTSANQTEPPETEKASVTGPATTSVEEIEEVEPEETILWGPKKTSVEQVKLSEPEEETQQGSKFEAVKPTELPKSEAVETSASLRPVKAADQGSDSDEISTLKKNVADLSKEVGKLSVALQTITQLEERVKELEAVKKLLPDSIEILKTRIDKISGILKMIQQKQPDSAFLKNFVCSKCRSKGLVAIYVKCTSCGKENWMGWWPDEKDQ